MRKVENIIYLYFGILVNSLNNVLSIIIKSSLEKFEFELLYSVLHYSKY